MFVIQRDDLKRDKAWNILLNALIKIHVPEQDTVSLLLSKADVKGFTEVRRHFLILDNKYYVSYVANSYLKEGLPEPAVGVQVESVTVYDDYVEYETTRHKMMSEAASQTGLNLS